MKLKNILLIFGILIAQLLHILSMYVPFMQGILKTEPVDFVDWLVLVPIAALVLVVIEAFKIILKKTLFKTVKTSTII
ncbi:cation transporting ATPase C-terminal domain-containing protein [Candidatus Peregrinibacteria bacterium]|nr:cation transporting ATPase C-terminal domain-containing protein [Candidatus Peregrinibacteria bacterium]